MAKEVTIKLKVPDWIDEERVKAHVYRAAEGLLASAEQSADEARRFFGVVELRKDIDVSESLRSEFLKLRRERVW